MSARIVVCTGVNGATTWSSTVKETPTCTTGGRALWYGPSTATLKSLLSSSRDSSRYLPGPTVSSRGLAVVDFKEQWTRRHLFPSCLRYLCPPYDASSTLW